MQTALSFIQKLVDTSITSLEFCIESIMPSDKKKQKQQKNAIFEFDDEDKEKTPNEEAPPVAQTKQKKRPGSAMSDGSESEDDIRADENPNEMSSLLNSFGADISKTLSAKRKRLAVFTSASLKTSNRKYDEIFTAQENERVQMRAEYDKQMGSVFSQWESDIQKSKDSEEKLENIIRQLQKTMQQQRVVQNQRLKSLKTLHEQYSKSQSELGRLHTTQQANITGELKKEMSALQKKMMDDARQEEIANVRKSLQSMLSNTL